MTEGARRAASMGLVLAGAGVTAVAAGVAVLSAVIAHALVTPPRRRRDDVRILGIDESGIRVERTRDTELPGRYALWIDDRLVRIGRIVAEDETTVTRSLGGKARVRLDGTTTARFSGYHLSRPRDLDVPRERVEVETELGPAPAWILGDQSADLWCVQVHGRGVTRRETIRAIPAFASLGIPSIAVSYRNDGEAPRSDDGKYRLGLDEWRDVDAAIDVAIARGATRIVVMGWSMGGAISLQLARRSRHRRRIVGLVLESPVVTWEPTLKLHTALFRLPGALVHTATTLLESPVARLTGGSPLDFDELDAVRFADSYRIPILLLHSRDDGYVPATASRLFAEARPDIVEYHEWHGARHTKLWNYDEARFETTIVSWLERHGLLPG